MAPLRAIQSRGVAAHCVFLCLTLDGYGLNRSYCTRTARRDRKRHDEKQDFRQGVRQRAPFRAAQPLHSDNPRRSSEPIGLDTVRYSLSIYG
ncbi:hypothetical protein E7Z57_03460 [Ralstonia pseudosolanacearum]|uniref:Uncharacterized protein n=1 Tax=Ralstonia solanacearum TaxID=305 RepID=A0AA92EAK4_RALSL|nr:hypothetical protein E7Z57_03460 [Ralstonia pseudosolanacearum]